MLISQGVVGSWPGCAALTTGGVLRKSPNKQLDDRESMMCSSSVFANVSSNVMHNGVAVVGITRRKACDRFG